MEIQANFYYLAVVILLVTTTDLKPAAFWDFINFLKKSFGQLFQNETKQRFPIFICNQKHEKRPGSSVKPTRGKV